MACACDSCRVGPHVMSMCRLLDVVGVLLAVKGFDRVDKVSPGLLDVSLALQPCHNPWHNPSRARVRGRNRFIYRAHAEIFAKSRREPQATIRQQLCGGSVVLFLFYLSPKVFNDIYICVTLYIFGWDGEPYELKNKSFDGRNNGADFFFFLLSDAVGRMLAEKRHFFTMAWYGICRR